MTLDDGNIRVYTETWREGEGSIYTIINTFFRKIEEIKNKDNFKVFLTPPLKEKLPFLDLFSDYKGIPISITFGDCWVPRDVPNKAGIQFKVVYEVC